ncbi:MAG: hypothetical protein Q9161_009384 [Pseudevernia consocians]
MDAYQDIVKKSRAKAREGKVKLPPRVKASAKARQIIYTKLYVDTKGRERMRQIFNYAQDSARLFVELVCHYSSNGILAMKPAKLTESRLRGGDRLATIIEILDSMRPDLCSQKLKLCPEVIATTADGGCPDEETMTKLDDGIRG